MVHNALPQHRLPVSRAVIWAEELKQHKFTARQRTLRSGPPSKNTFSDAIPLLGLRSCLPLLSHHHSGPDNGLQIDVSQLVVGGDG